LSRSDLGSILTSVRNLPGRRHAALSGRTHRIAARDNPPTIRCSSGVEGPA
jgi:hypothetical protein